MNDVLATVIARLREMVFADDNAITIDSETRLVELDVLTSIDYLDLINFLEEEYGFRANPDDLTSENFATPAAIARLAVRSMAKS